MKRITAVCLTRYPERKDMFAQALHAYDLQTYPNKELVIVNDGKPIVPTRVDVTVINLPEKATIGAKRNVGLRHARGEFIAPWDDDDFSMPERMELQMAQIHRDGVASVRSSLIWVTTADLNVKGLFYSTNYQTSLMDKAAVEKVGGYPDINYCEDMELDIRLRLRGYRCSHDPAFFYIHRRHTMNVSNPYEGGGRHFANMIPSSETPRVNARLAALLAMPRSTLIQGILTGDGSSIPTERPSVP